MHDTNLASSSRVCHHQEVPPPEQGLILHIELEWNLVPASSGAYFFKWFLVTYISVQDNFKSCLTYALCHNCIIGGTPFFVLQDATYTWLTLFCLQIFGCCKKWTACYKNVTRFLLSLYYRRLPVFLYIDFIFGTKLIQYNFTSNTEQAILPKTSYHRHLLNV